jgi:nitroimidazol reductase NimA-like FMN-containing flavoprotein (pyridoxamine 5'-phosphate oxidase superfamily)
METRNLGELYDLAPLDWAPIPARLEKGYTQAPGTGGPDRHSTWLATINPDGSPHVTGIGAMWIDDTFWFVTAETSRKGRNLARDPRCSLSVATQEFDLVFEGEAHKVTDPAAVAATCDRFHDDGWPCRVDDSGQALTADYSAPSAGPPPWHVYRVTPRAATALQVVEPNGATHWTF